MKMKKLEKSDKVLLLIIFVVWLDMAFIGHFNPTEKKIQNFLQPVTSVVHSMWGWAHEAERRRMGPYGK